MKFVFSQDIRKNRPLAQLLIFFNLATLLLLGLSIQFESFKWGLSISNLHLRFYGNEELFIQPIELQTLLAEVHTELFIYLFVVLMILLIYQLNHKKTMMRDSTFLFAVLFLNSVAPLGAFFVGDFFVYIKFTAYPLLVAGLAVMAFKNIVFLHKKPEVGGHQTSAPQKVARQKTAPQKGGD